MFVRRAMFNDTDHCVTPGWAVRRARPTIRQRLCSFMYGHRVDASEPKNDYCPQAHTRCVRCSVPMAWYNPGRHRYGGMNDLEMQADHLSGGAS